MVKKPPTKAEIRAALEQETRDYLKSGGKVQEVPSGVSGTDPAKAQAFHSGALFSRPRSTRTFVPEVVAAIESRRGKLKAKRHSVRQRARLSRPRRKIIYDDFGEPVRKIWIDD